MVPLVEPPMAECTMIAFLNAAGVRILDGVICFSTSKVFLRVVSFLTVTFSKNSTSGALMVIFLLAMMVMVPSLLA